MLGGPHLCWGLWAGLTCAAGVLQVFYRTSSQTTAQVLSTNQTSVELQLPTVEDYIIQVKATTAGGDGASSEQIRVPGISRESGWGGSSLPAGLEQGPWGIPYHLSTLPGPLCAKVLWGQGQCMQEHLVLMVQIGRKAETGNPSAFVSRL